MMGRNATHLHTGGGNRFCMERKLSAKIVFVDDFWQWQVQLF